VGIAHRVEKSLFPGTGVSLAESGMKVIVATRNPGKVREIRRVLRDLGIRVRSLRDFQGVPSVEEDGKSFTENALKKARFCAERLGETAIADDSGLEVDGLKGAPGIYSARYAGEGASDRENNQKLLREMEGIPPSKRGATFRCSIAIVSPGEKERVVEGSCRGRIGLREVGKKGFGYDPLFFLPRYGKTMAQLTVDEKNEISHRGKALKKLRKVIGQFLDLR
jgi:XTP/dITP diphosphohydrolase